ncbi:hypothetical protein F5H01DRAFT_331492 [Linnemannia elongata]|nr:hypothetical protein F5H01DRAFT_331492 [Linnemannia elongata]
MEDKPTPPPPPSSLANEIDGGPNPPIPPTDLPPTNSASVPKISFADAVNKGAHKVTNKAAWNSLRSKTESREALGQEKADPVWFSLHNHPFSVAIPYNTKTHSVTDVVEAAIKSFPNAKSIDFLTTRGAVFLSFGSSEEKATSLGTPLDCLPSPLPILPTMYSAGSRLKIRAEYTPLQSDDGAKIAEDVFGPFGKVMLVNHHYMHGSSIRSRSFDFVLEIPHSSPQDLLIPRVALVDTMNVLFSWSGSKFCYRCGEGSHTKPQCPKPLDFNLATTAALGEPIMARALPDPDAPLREPIKKNAPFMTGSATPKQVSFTETEWQMAGRGKNKRSRNASSGGGNTSASDSDSPKPPPRKQAPQHQGSTRTPRPKSSAAQQTKSDLNVAAAISSSSFTKVDPSVAPAETAEAASTQEPAQAVAAVQSATLGDTPDQHTEQQQQETEQQPEHQLDQQHQPHPEPHSKPQTPAKDVAMAPDNTSKEAEEGDKHESDGKGQEEKMDEDEDNYDDIPEDNDTDMTTKLGDKQAKSQVRRDKQEAKRLHLDDRMSNIFQSTPTPKASRATTKKSNPRSG